MKTSRVKMPLNPWGPWKDNPSKPENFYGINEEIKKEEIIEESIDAEEIIEKIEEKTEKVSLNIQESTDPYADILKDLK